MWHLFLFNLQIYTWNLVRNARGTWRERQAALFQPRYEDGPLGGTDHRGLFPTPRDVRFYGRKSLVRKAGKKSACAHPFDRHFIYENAKGRWHQYCPQKRTLCFKSQDKQKCLLRRQWSTLSDTSTTSAFSITKSYSSYVGIQRGAGQDCFLSYKILTSHGQEGSPYSKYRTGGTKFSFWPLSSLHLLYTTKQGPPPGLTESHRGGPCPILRWAQLQYGPKRWW